MPWISRRGHVGTGPLERVFPTVDDLPRSDGAELVPEEGIEPPTKGL